MTQEQDPLLERLRASASGDAALRQLRRRYDILREDYESLLDRLTDLEERVSVQPEEHAPPPRQAPAAIAAPQTVAESLASPLLRMRDEFLAAADGIQAIVLGLEELAAVAFGQQRARSTTVTIPADTEPAGPPPPAPEQPEMPQRIEIEAHGQGFGELLDFQERLSRVEGVARVSISAIDNQHSMLVVELEAVD